MAGAISRGLTLTDFEIMTLGQVVDYCITYNNIHGEKNNSEERNATLEEIQGF